ncbi:serine hydrolase [Albibacterium indicum]|uniref:serine hydrolase n=1 Tax=Albibacterium indicum TaxID=2292082 RepID=UPI000E49D098|nr:serine hydrolase [Pedobacter indicus]
MENRIHISTFFIMIFSLLLTSNSLWAQGLSEQQIDSIAEKTLATFNVPGIAVAVIKDGEIVHSKGYGVRSIESKKKVDENTLFGVASNTKAFTAASLGILVDQGKITWDTKVTDIIPEFKLYDAYVTREFTIRDLLTHRSGLGLGAGDLMIWPDSNSTTKSELIHNLRYLKPVSSFRSKYDYDNLLYIVAGEIVARASGMDYEDFVVKHFIEPLGMTQTAMSWYRLKDRSNIIDGHAPVNGQLETVGLSFSEVANAAGGMYSNIKDMSKWVITQLNHGKYGPELKDSLFSETVHRETWTPQTIIRGRSPYEGNPFVAYGLGWNLSMVDGHLQVMHTGGLAGIVTQVTMIPELNLGIIVLTNQQSGYAFNSISNSIKDAYFGKPAKDWIGQYNEMRQASQKRAAEITDALWTDINSQQHQKPIEYNQYIGTFTDPWFGNVTIEKRGNNLYFQSEKSPKLQGTMYFYKGNTFIVKWNDRTLDADAFVMFTLNQEGEADGFKMEAISPLTDFSFDFHDLDFNRK